MIPASLSAVARHFTFVRETDGPNCGAFVSKFQRECGGHDGDSWCADFVSFVLDVAYHGGSPIVRSASTQVLLADARKKGYVVPAAAVEDLYFFLNDVGLPHHVGIVTGVDVPTVQGITIPLLGIAGNTSPDGTSANGAGVFEHALNVAPDRIVFVRLPR